MSGGVRIAPLVCLAVGGLTLGLAVSCSSSSSRSNSATTAAATTSNTTTSSTSSNAAPVRTNTAQVVERIGEGWLELKQGRKVVHVKGGPRERGYQYGYLLADEIEGVFNALETYVSAQGAGLPGSVIHLLSPAGAYVYKPFFSAAEIEELEAIVDGMRAKHPGTPIDLDDLLFVNALIDVGGTVDFSVFKCSSLAVWGSLTEQGKLFQTRCIDLTTGTGLEDHAVVVYVKPEGGVPYVNPGWAGMIGCPSGLNAHGIGIGQVWAFSDDRQLGRPWILATMELLASGDDVGDAVRIFLNDQRTYGSNFVFTDRGDARGGQPRGIAVESTSRDLVVFRDDDPREDLALYNGQPYGIRIKDAVFRGDCALDPHIRSRQTASNGPHGDPRTASAYKNRYKGQADGIQAYATAGIKIGAAECIEITKNVAMPNHSLQCCVYANSDLELWVANAQIDAQGNLTPAFQGTYENHSLDYFTPTLKIVPDHTQPALGSTLNLAFPITTLGSERQLEVRVRLETPAGTHDLGVVGLTLPKADRVTPTLSVTIPAGAPTGNATLVADLHEAYTTDLVDCAELQLTLTR